MRARLLKYELIFLLLAAALVSTACRGGPGPEDVEVLESLYRRPDAVRYYWPTDEWRIRAPEQTGLDSARLQEALAYAFARTGPEEERRGIRTDGLVLIKDGYLVAERYSGRVPRRQETPGVVGGQELFHGALRDRRQRRQIPSGRSRL